MPAKHLLAQLDDLTEGWAAALALIMMSRQSPDPTQFDAGSKYFDAKSDPENPRWLLVDIKHVRDLKRNVTLTEMKQEAESFGDFQLLKKGNRLSIMPVTEQQWNRVLELEKR